MRAAVYARVSSAQQREAQSIESQLRTLPAFVSARGWQLVGTYVDDGRSAKAGKLAKREGLARLRAALLAGGIDVVVVSDLSRMTRSEDLAERGEILGAVQRAGAKLALADSGQILDLATSSGDLLASLFGYVAAEENRTRRERTLRAHEQAAVRGRKPRGKTPFGLWYDKNTKLIHEHPDEAELVREAYRRVADGEAAWRVGVAFEMRGVKASQGGRWAANVARLLRSPIYRGEWVVDAARGHRIDVPALVEDALWYAANAQLDRNVWRGLDRTVHVYLAAGRLVCGVCGAKVGVHREARSKRPSVVGGRAYYRCKTNRFPAPGQPRCTLPLFRQPDVDARVWAVIEKIARRPDLVDVLAGELAGGDEASIWDADAEDARRQLADLQQAEEAILERFARGAVSPPALDATLARLGDRRRFLERQAAQAAQAGATTRRRAMAAASAAETVRALRERLAATTAETRRELVRALIPGIRPHVVTLLPDGRIEVCALLATVSEAAPRSLSFRMVG